MSLAPAELEDVLPRANLARRSGAGGSGFDRHQDGSGTCQGGAWLHSRLASGPGQGNNAGIARSLNLRTVSNKQVKYHMAKVTRTLGLGQPMSGGVLLCLLPFATCLLTYSSFDCEGWPGARKKPLTRPATAGEGAVAGHPLPSGEGGTTHGRCRLSRKGDGSILRHDFMQAPPRSKGQGNHLQAARSEGGLR